MWMNCESICTYTCKKHVCVNKTWVQKKKNEKKRTKKNYIKNSQAQEFLNGNEMVDLCVSEERGAAIPLEGEIQS